MRTTIRPHWIALCLFVVVAGCPAPKKPVPPAVDSTNHTFFPIAKGDKHEFGATLLPEDGAISCESCHPSTVDSFTTPVCTDCHGHTQEVTDRLHLQVVPTAGAPGGYAYDSLTCVSSGCHRSSDHKQFDHAGITDSCAMCHDVGKGFAALPFTLPDGSIFAHPSMNSSDCGVCHTGFVDWKNAMSATQFASDPSTNVTVMAQIPTFSGFDIVRPMAPQTEVLPMMMNHASPELTAAANSNCGNCHVGAQSGNFPGRLPGRLHSSLSNLTLAQPTACASCHTSAMPLGFVALLVGQLPHHHHAARGRGVVGDRAHHDVAGQPRVRHLPPEPELRGRHLDHRRQRRQRDGFPRVADRGRQDAACLVPRLPRQLAT
jgi:hypothetical protein